MHVTAADVISLNGNITQGDDDVSWASAEDWQHFLGLVRRHKVLVMGSGTYEAIRPEPDPERLRVVLTSRPDNYADVAEPGSLEFKNETPEDLVSRLGDAGCERLLLVGGRVSTRFLAAGLVDELYITIEPLLLGYGKKLFEDLEESVRLRLLSCRKLNDSGTLLMHYQVDKGDSRA